MTTGHAQFSPAHPALSAPAYTSPGDTPWSNQLRASGTIEVPLWAMTLMAFALGLFFVDEALRKAVPSGSFYVTAAKDVLFWTLGLWALTRPGLRYTSILWLFAPWLIVAALSGAYTSMQFAKPAVPLALIRTYAYGPPLIALGLYIGQNEPMARMVFRLSLIGVALTAITAVFQEHALGLLPGFLQQNNYKEAHDIAAGRFNEGLFGSSQVLSLVLVAASTYLLAGIVATPRLGVRFALAACLLLAAYGVYVARVRIGMLALLLSMGVLLFGLFRSDLPRRLLGGRVVTGGILLLVAAGVLTVVLPNQDAYTLEGDVTFYEKALSFEAVWSRLFFFENELAGSGVPPLVGQGLGTAGAVRSVINDTQLFNLESTADTGISLIFGETGYIGLATFLVGFAGIPLLVAARIIFGRRVPVMSLASGVVAITAAGWFFFKSHTVLGNGASQIVWMLSTGLFFGFLHRTRDGESGEIAAAPPLDERLQHPTPLVGHRPSPARDRRPRRQLAPRATVTPMPPGGL